MKNISTRQIIDIILIVLLLIFIGQNLEGVRTKFLMFAFEMPLFILIGISFFIGFYTARAFQNRSNK